MKNMMKKDVLLEINLGEFEWGVIERNRGRVGGFKDGIGRDKSEVYKQYKKGSWELRNSKGSQV